MRKAEQAAAYAAASFTGTVPAYIQAEAAATGYTPQAAAERILQIALIWDESVGPAIERLRIWASRQSMRRSTSKRWMPSFSRPRRNWEQSE